LDHYGEGVEGLTNIAHKGGGSTRGENVQENRQTAPRSGFGQHEKRKNHGWKTFREWLRG